MAGSKQINHDLDLLSISRIINLPDAISAQQPVTLSQLEAQAKGLAWKDNVRVAPDNNVNIASPGASLDSISMVVGDRVLLRNETVASTNGVYVWNGAAVPMTRSTDANSSAGMLSAIVTVDEGTNTGTVWRQSAVNITIGTTSLTFVPFQTSVPNATTTTPGVVQIATQGEVDAGADASKVVTPATLTAWSKRNKAYVEVFGDASATSYVITHNLGTRNIMAVVRQTATPYKEVGVDISATTSTTATISMNVAPGTNAYTVTFHAV